MLGRSMADDFFQDVSAKLRMFEAFPGAANAGACLLRWATIDHARDEECVSCTSTESVKQEVVADMRGSGSCAPVSVTFRAGKVKDAT